MRSKVKFVFNSKDQKHAFIEPVSIELKKAIEAEYDTTELLIEDEKPSLALRVAKRLLQLDMLMRDNADPAIAMIQDEIIKIETARLLLTLYSYLESSPKPEHKELYEFMKESLALLKHADLQKGKEKGEA